MEKIHQKKEHDFLLQKTHTHTHTHTHNILYGYHLNFILFPTNQFNTILGLIRFDCTRLISIIIKMFVGFLV